MTGAPGPSLSRALAAWGDDTPSWVLALAKACDAQSQTVVGRRIGYSGTVANQVLGRTYGGSLARVEAAFRGAYMRETVGCPVCGEIGKDVCVENQRKPFANTNPSRVRLYVACRTCPNAPAAARKEPS